jgi:hypothetical protein
MPPLVATDRTQVLNAADYVGTFRGERQALELTAEEVKLVLRYGGQTLALELRTLDSFFVPHADFELALLDFGREDGKVVEAFHGGEWFRKDGHAGPAQYDFPKDWTAYAGHYRARNPELSNFRVVVRKDALIFLNPWGNREPLLPLEPGLFRVGANPYLAETLRFSAVVDGQALRADYSGCPYFRTFAP